MATEETPGTPETDSTETVDQEATGQSTEETPKDETESQTPPSDNGQKLPDDHPLVKAYEAQKVEIRELRKKANTENHEATVAELDTTKATLADVQKRYDRLEEFLSKSGSPLGKALDSKSFTTALFETDGDIGELVKSWNKDNPSPTSVALGSDKVVTADNKPSINDLLRQAVK